MSSNAKSPETLTKNNQEPAKEDVLICRCQEVTESEIVAAIRDGATTVDGVKRRTRAGMGLCQGKTCGRLVQRLVARETGQKPDDVFLQKNRMPARPLKMGDFCGGNENV